MRQSGETTAIIGGGAAGLACAIAAAECGDQVVLLERMDRVGKKLAATGNGRCNLMNVREARYPGGDGMARHVLSLCGVEELTAFWRDHGLLLREETEGRVYPATLQASTVVDLLRWHCERLGVQTITGFRAEGLRRTDSGWVVAGEGREIPCRRVVVAGGGKAQPKLGSDGSAYALLTGQGHRMIPCRPSVTQLVTETEPIRGLSGIRVKAEVVLRGAHGEKARSEGELLFTDYGVSGICVMDVSRDAEKGDVLSVNLAKPMGLDSPQTMLRELAGRREMWKGQDAERLLCGLVLPRIALRLFDAAGCRCRDRLAGDLTNVELQRIVDAFFDFRLRVLGVRGFDSAQVTAGGIAAEEFDQTTMESRLAPGLFAAGEVLDVDGKCGGYNLMFAFASGILAGLKGRKSPYRRDRT